VAARRSASAQPSHAERRVKQPRAATVPYSRARWAAPRPPAQRTAST
jgi:hypothetical protein